jgi:radical SAM protein with 4Fe4S-binding SPASM domain
MYNLNNLFDKIKRDGFQELFRSIKINAFFWMESQILFHFPRLLPLAFTKPRFVNIELTNACNLKCKMCLRGSGRKLGYMDFKLFKWILDKCADIGGISLNFHWSGEATLHPEFTRFIKYAIGIKKRFYKLTLTTNGTLFTGDIARVCLDLDTVTFSLDGIGEVNDKIRIGSDYKTIKKNILDFLELRGSNPAPIISTNTTITTQTQDELLDIFEEFGDKKINVNYSGCLGENFRILDKTRIKKYNPSWLNVYSSPRCYMPFEHLLITWEGNVNICCHNLKGKFPIGNIKEGIMRIWNHNRKLNKIREGIIKKKPYFYSICFTCEKHTWT